MAVTNPSPFGPQAPGSPSVQQTYFSDPNLVSGISGDLGDLQRSLMSQYQGLLQNPTSSPLFQGQLGPLLQSMVPSENRSRQQVTDQFRAAGGLRSGAYGNTVATNEQNILGNRSTEAGKLLGQSFPQLMQALQNPMGQISALLNALTLSQGQGATPQPPTVINNSGWGSIPPSQGLSTPMFGDSMPSTAGSGQQGLNGSQYGYNTSAPRTTAGFTYGTPGTVTPVSTNNPNAGSYDLFQQLLGGSGGSGVMYNPRTGSYESAPSAGVLNGASGTYYNQNTGTWGGNPNPTIPTWYDGASTDLSTWPGQGLYQG